MHIFQRLCRHPSGIGLGIVTITGTDGPVYVRGDPEYAITVESLNAMAAASGAGRPGLWRTVPYGGYRQARAAAERGCPGLCVLTVSMILLLPVPALSGIIDLIGTMPERAEEAERLVGNFGFMFDDDHAEEYRKFSQECFDAEQAYADGSWKGCLRNSRSAAEFMILYIYDQPQFEMPKQLADKNGYMTSSKMVDAVFRLQAPKFIRFLHSPSLYNMLDHVRDRGNKSMHDPDRIVTREEALEALQAIFGLALLIERRTWEDPYTAEFIEPYNETTPEFFEAPEEPPEPADYRHMIDECRANGEDELAAKYALLLSSDDPELDLEAFAAVLPAGTPIRELIAMLRRPEMLVHCLRSGSFMIGGLIGRCYYDFSIREKETVCALCTRRIRAWVTAAAGGIEDKLANMRMEA